MKKNNFRYALTLALMLYDVDINDMEAAEEIGLVAYNFIGNKNTKLAHAILDVDPKFHRAKLPCNCDLIESVTYPFVEDWQYTSNTHDFGDIATHYTEDYIESQKFNLDPLYQSGKFVKYRQEGQYIYVNKGFPKVSLLYHELVTDEDGLPEITDKEAIAIAEYIAYTEKYKEAIKTNNKVLMEVASGIKLQWLIHCDAARTPDYISQNEADMMLETITSHNRKKYGFSYKPTL